LEKDLDNNSELPKSNFDEKLDKYDARGVQTLFRTLLRNHYNLLKMVDSKSSIILTINSIIISLLMGALYVAPETDIEVLEVSTKILINFSMLSMLFALISMLPHRYIGKRFVRSGYKGSLYAANFSTQTLEEFQTEIVRVMQNGKSLYDEMTKDLYFLGKVISYKQRMLWLSVLVFLAGILTVLITTSLYNLGIL
tara:strand:+ start:1214 stop:1801 length:588 start_codon:yes stop_codon:yes gene_type:complete